MQEKLLTSELFKDKKDSYQASVKLTFKTDRLQEHSSYKALPNQKTQYLRDNLFFVEKSETIQVIKKIIFVILSFCTI